MGRSEAVRELADRRRQLRALLPRAWSAERSSFLRQDREAHTRGSSEILVDGTGAGRHRLGRTLASPSRLRLVVEAAGRADAVRAKIRGRAESGRLRADSIAPESLRWETGFGCASSEIVFASVESIEVQGLGDDVGWRLATPDLDSEDLTQYLPLWAGMVEPAEAAGMVARLFTPDGYLRPGGLGLLPGAAPKGDRVWFPLNLLVAEGLLRYGYRKPAADLLERMMIAAVEALSRDRGVREAVDPHGLQGVGKLHHLAGLPPLSLYLDVFGIGLQNPQRVRLADGVVGEAALTVRWRHLRVRRDAAETVVTFPSGASRRVSSQEALEVVESVEAQSEPDGRVL